MLMAGDSSNWSDFPAGGELAADDLGGDEMCMDVDALFRLLEEDPTSGPEDYELQAEAGSGAGYHEETQLQSGSQVLKGEPSIDADLMGPSSGYPSDNVGLCNPPYISEASDSAAGTGGSHDSAGNHGMVINHKHTGLRAQTGSPGHACSTSPKDWISLVPCKETCFTDRAGLGVENIDTSLRTYCPFGENATETLGPSENNSCTSVEPFMDICSPNVASTDSDIFTDHYPATDDTSLDNLHLENSSMQPSPYHYFPSHYPSNEEMMTNVKDESVEFQTDSSCSSSKMNVNYQDGTTGNYIFDSPMMIDGVDVEEWNLNYGSNNCVPAISGNSSFNVDFCPADNKASVKPLSSTETYISGKREVTGVKDEKIDEFDARSSDMYHSFPFVDETVGRNSSYSADGGFFDKESKPSSFDLSSQTLGCSGHSEEDMFVGTERACYSKDNTNGSSFSMDGGTRSVELSGSEHQLPAAQPFYSNKNLGYKNAGHEAKIMQHKSTGFPLSKFSPETTHSTLSYKPSIQDDPDICILENLSDPAPSSCLPVVSHTRYPAPLHLSPALGSTLVNQQQSSDEDTGVGGMRFKTRDEQLILRVALQDLSQPKSEAIPPDGLLTVPLLRHQRIALSWMVQKETASLHCSGGILADDQGLGKTISTIALILKERAPPFGACEGHKKCKQEALDLDKDEDMHSEDSRRKKDAPNATSEKRIESLTQTKGRPAAGTLVVCPTSVLRQWAEELRSKVTEKANLSVLVYHGGNRTRDPCELAKYDVVLTTYSIVSMEVPKQPLADEEDGEKRKKEEYDTPHMGFPSSKKRKYPPSSGNKPSKGKKKGLESVTLESVARPLAKVGWFRVVLDEAQSIKNHKTQVARACWGLRAKRRWCLSGTPIQNAIDDLYSYFRFLRYDPYAVYKSFCATIKFPISRNPTKGYRKLQAVLKTIMLRRTKGTLLDGEPIVKLPPKSVELKRVEFSEEERDFYSRLECDSRAQFQEYAAAGTVKQNYVNILLMLLRLRQACDHPLLVRRYESQSLWKSSVEKAKKLPHDKQVSLLNCLEASLAICGICNDAPEDAVVSECGHVFCSQCICDSLTGDDNQCPNTNCKVRLNVSSVFSKATLTSSLSDQPNEGGMASEVFDAVESFYEDSSYNSSKIKAALQVLCSMCKPKDCTTGNSCLEEIVDKNASSSTDSPDNDGVESLEDLSDTQNLALDRSSKKSEDVVREKAIVFSQWTRMLDLLEASLKTSGLEYRRLDGTMSVMARDKAVKDFNTIPEVTVMIMSLKAASLGLNMVAACRVLLLDLWWNPTTEDQAIDRAHRIGQTRPVTVLRLTVKDTVEDRILALQKKKREMVASAFGEDEAGGRQTRLTVDDLKYLFMM